MGLAAVELKLQVSMIGLESFEKSQGTLFDLCFLHILNCLVSGYVGNLMQ